jgi:hypothetical protein
MLLEGVGEVPYCHVAFHQALLLMLLVPHVMKEQGHIASRFPPLMTDEVVYAQTWVHD